MRILLNNIGMDGLSGSPLYFYELARELSKEHEVSMCSTSWVENELKFNLIKCGVRCIGIKELKSEYDLILSSHWKPRVKGFLVNIVHSEYSCETPFNEADHYVAIRPSIKEHIIKEHNIPEDKISVIYNGIDRERFKKREKTKRDFNKIVVPCTLDTLREKFLNHIISKANKDNRVILIGDKCGAKLERNEFTTILPSMFNIEREIADADMVAGILLGRVNLEALSCGVKSVIYDPITLENYELIMTENEFNERHNIVNVAEKITSLKK